MGTDGSPLEPRRISRSGYLCSADLDETFSKKHVFFWFLFLGVCLAGVLVLGCVWFRYSCMFFFVNFPGSQPPF